MRLTFGLFEIIFLPENCSHGQRHGGSKAVIFCKLEKGRDSLTVLNKLYNFDFKVYTTISGCSIHYSHIIQAIAAKQSLRGSIFPPPQNSPATQIVQLKAQDNDTGRNGLLTYSILNGQGLKFRINETTGILYSTAPFDYEEELTEYQVCFRFFYIFFIQNSLSFSWKTGDTCAFV